MKADALITWNNLQDDLRTLVFRKVKNKAIADDIIQDVFIKVQTNLPKLKDTNKLPAWIYRITQHVVMDHFRKKGTTITPLDIDWESSQQEFNGCVAHCLNVLLEELPEKYREALKLTELENLSQYDLAARLNISHSGARSRVQRARKMLKEKIEVLYLIKTDPYGNIIACENRSPCCCKMEC